MPDAVSEHRFRVAVGPGLAAAAGDACAACGSTEAAHTEAVDQALTDPERQVVVAMLNQPQPPPLMRRSILRKLTRR